MIRMVAHLHELVTGDATRACPFLNDDLVARRAALGEPLHVVKLANENKTTIVVVTIQEMRCARKTLRSHTLLTADVVRDSLLGSELHKYRALVVLDQLVAPVAHTVLLDEAVAAQGAMSGSREGGERR